METFPETFLPAVKALADVYLIDLMAEKKIDWVFFSPAGAIEPGQRTDEISFGQR